jgi:hypothetical protein
MFFPPRLASPRRRLFPAFALLLIAGCTGTSANQNLEKSLATIGHERTAVYPLAGKITVDGQPPDFAEGDRIIVMLNDAAKLGAAATGPYVYVGKDGDFTFRTYGTDDGAPAGTYIVTFAKLKVKKRSSLVGPDGFHNLYNDAERNQQEYPDFKIEHKARGKKDYLFDLRIAGREEVVAGPKALTRIK